MKSINISKLYYTILLVLSCMLLSSNTQAQDDQNVSLLDKISLGVGTGVNFSTMQYTNPNLASYKSSLFMRGAIGGFMEINLTNNISIRPEVYIIGKGQKINDQGILYKFKSVYYDWKLPLIYNFNKFEAFTPYLMVAPALGFASGGSIYLDDGNYTWQTDITDGNLFPLDLSLQIGTGIKVPIKSDNINLVAGIEVAYSLGIVDTYSTNENDATSTGINMSYDPVNEKRYNRGTSIVASIAVPLSNFKRKKKPTVKKKTPPKVIAEPEKDCYTIEEINQMLNAGKSINNKVICMNNLNFELNKSTLDKDSEKYLDNIVALLEKAPSMKMKISGHTDNTGEEEYNLQLSEKRAAAVYNYLINQGILENRLSYEYFGSSKPIVPNDTSENRSKNRRVEFEIIEK